jgi:enoyl-CoA hydratase
MDYKYVLLDKVGTTAVVTLNRPEKLNALSVTLREELIHAMKTAEADSEVHCVVLKGAGRAFCSGYDISVNADPNKPPPPPPTIRQDIQNLYKLTDCATTILNLAKPVIAQVHGYCLAGGTDIATHCDVIVCAEDATIGFPAVRAMGSPPTHMWTYLVGPAWAKYILLTGNSIDGRTAERIGLALKAVPAEQLEATTMELAELMGKIDPDLLMANKRIVNKAMDNMGRYQTEMEAAETDAIAHQARAVLRFRETSRTKGVKAALEERDGPFRDLRGARVGQSPRPTTPSSAPASPARMPGGFHHD